jgi:hypothetical protein
MMLAVSTERVQCVMLTRSEVKTLADNIAELLADFGAGLVSRNLGEEVATGYA